MLELRRRSVLDAPPSRGMTAIWVAGVGEICVPRMLRSTPPLAWCAADPGSMLLVGPGSAEQREEAPHRVRYTGVRSVDSLFLFRFLRHPIEAILHVLHFTAQVVYIVVFGRRLRNLLGLSGGGRAHARRHERLEHRERLLKKFHVAADVLFQRRKGRPAECI